MLCPSVERPQLINDHMAAEICFSKDITIVNSGTAGSSQKSHFPIETSYTYTDKKSKPMLLQY